MFILERLKWKRLLKGSDYHRAGHELIALFKDKVIPNDLAALLTAYIENPGLDSAIALIQYDARYISSFELSKSFLKPY